MLLGVARQKAVVTMWAFAHVTASSLPMLECARASIAQVLGGFTGRDRGCRISIPDTPLLCLQFGQGGQTHNRVLECWNEVGCRDDSSDNLENVGL